MAERLNWLLDLECLIIGVATGEQANRQKGINSK